MTFNPAIPRPTDLLSNSQQDLQTNNVALNATFSRNHIPLNISTDNGKHTFIEMPISAGIPTPVPGLSANEGTLYTKAVSSVNQLFYTPGTSGIQFQLTPCLPLRVYANFDGTGANGTIPGGNIRSSFNVSSIVKNSTGDYTINFTTAIPTNNYIVQAIGMRSTADDIMNVQLRGTTNYGNVCTTTSVRLQTNGGTSGLENARALMVQIYGG